MYRLTKAAEKDIAGIFRGGAAKFGLAQAEAYHEGLTRQFEFLARTPQAARERRDVSPPVRLLPCGAHVIIYRIVGADVLIIRVLHGRQDWERHF